MKILKLGLLLGCICFLISCSSNDDLSIFDGEWKLTQTSGGIGGGGFEFEGDLILRIEGDDIKGYLDGSIAFKADIEDEEGEYYDYALTNKEYADESDNTNFGISDKMIISINDESLTLSDTCADCYSYHFNKN